MKIISRGNQRLTCETCASVLEYEYPDIQFDSMGPYIICPICRKQIDVDRTIKPRECVNDYNSITVTGKTWTVTDPHSSGYDLFVRDGAYCSATGALATAADKIAASVTCATDSLTTLNAALSSIEE